MQYRQTDTVATAGLGRLMWMQLNLILSGSMLRIGPSHSKYTFSDGLLRGNPKGKAALLGDIEITHVKKKKSWVVVGGGGIHF